MDTPYLCGTQEPIQQTEDFHSRVYARLARNRLFREKEYVMHVSNTINPAMLAHFFKMVADGAIREEDLGAFCNNPQLWRVPADSATLTHGDAQAFWQGVYDDLAKEIEGRIIVPPVPRLTDKQKKSLDKFGFLPVYVPTLTEDRYPACFVKPGWGQYLNADLITRMPLNGKWVAVESIAKPHYDDRVGYPNDRLMAAVKKESRFYTSWDDLTNGLLAEIAKVTGFPKKGTRLPTAEEWNFVGNLFNWLREHRSMNLPNLGSTRSWEWCENATGAGRRLVIGRSADGGLADVYDGWQDGHGSSVTFRVLVDI